MASGRMRSNAELALDTNHDFRNTSYDQMKTLPFAKPTLDEETIVTLCRTLAKTGSLGESPRIRAHTRRTYADGAVDARPLSRLVCWSDEDAPGDVGGLHCVGSRSGPGA